MKHLISRLISVGLYHLLILAALLSCSDPISEEGYFVIGQNQRMKIERFQSPDTVYINKPRLEIDFDNDGEFEILFGYYFDDQNRCPSNTKYVYSRGNGMVSFLAGYEEHDAYVLDSIYIAFAELSDRVLVDTVFYNIKSFEPISDSIFTTVGRDVMLPFDEGDTVDLSGNWIENSIDVGYKYEHTNNHHVELGLACREPYSSITRNDTTYCILYRKDQSYTWDNPFNTEGGRYFCFKWHDGERDHLGWVKLLVEDYQIVIFEYAIER